MAPQYESSYTQPLLITGFIWQDPLPQKGSLKLLSFLYNTYLRPRYIVYLGPVIGCCYLGILTARISHWKYVELNGR